MENCEKHSNGDLALPLGSASFLQQQKTRI